jgi:hypothetical protein
MPKGPKDYSPAVSGNEGKPAKLRDYPPKLPPIQKHVHGLPMPVRVKVKDNMVGPGVAPTPSIQKPTGGTRKRHRSR